MEKRLKLRISRIFCSSLGSCKSRNITDAIDQPQPPSSSSSSFTQPPRQRSQLIELFSPHSHHFPSLCRPQHLSPHASTSILLRSQRPKVSDRNSLFASDGRKCPPASPISPPHKELSSNPRGKKQTKKKKKKKNKTHLKNKAVGQSESQRIQFDPLIADDYSHDWLSSEDDDETTLFSSKSLSSDSSDSFRRNRAPRRKNKLAAATRRKRATAAADDATKKKEKEAETGLVPLKGRIGDSFTVVKQSSDPYSDFRTSMVEMIVEKEMFGARDLENLLDCFLSLNSSRYHRLIVQVFTEICEALFSNWS